MNNPASNFGATPVGGIYERKPKQVRDDSEQMPPWVSDEPTPDSSHYAASELFVAGAISTLPPFDRYHPCWALPHAKAAIDALGKWEPDL